MEVVQTHLGLAAAHPSSTPLSPLPPTSTTTSRFPTTASSADQENVAPSHHHHHPNIQSPSPFVAVNSSKSKSKAKSCKTKTMTGGVYHGNLEAALANVNGNDIPQLTGTEETTPLSEADANASVKVVVRIRPVNRREREGVRIVHNLSSNALSIEERTYTFDAVLGPQSSQEDVFKLVGVPLVEDSLAGFNTAILSYGQTGSGKTYTMWGPPSAMLDCHSVNNYQGIVPRIFRLLFAEIHKKQVSSEEKQINYQCRCSFIEIYNEQINDLLDPTQRNLKVVNDARNGLHVENLTDEYVSTVEDVTQILVKGLSNRKVGATSMNSKSSRSHIIFTCIIESWSKGSSSKCFSSSKTSRINLVDLAGLDRENIDDVGRQIMKEGKHVKRSLSTLGKVINILVETACSGKDQKIPYNDSCLTQLLQNTIGGNSKITFVCAISPNDRQRAGTLSTLRFGERAKLLQNKAVINEITEDHVNDLGDQIRQLKDELIRAKACGGSSSEIANSYFKGENARNSLNHLRLSLNRSLILSRLDNDSEDELDVDEDDIVELCSHLSDPGCSSNKKIKDIKESENTKSVLSCNMRLNEKVDNITESNMVDSKDAGILEDSTVGGMERPDLKGEDGLNSAGNCLPHEFPTKSCHSNGPFLQLPLLQDPTICLSPKVDNKLKRSFTASLSCAVGSSVSTVEKQHARNCDSVRSSLHSSKTCPTESLAASLYRGLQIIDYHQSSAAKRSLLGLSFENLASTSCLPSTKVVAGALASPNDGGELGARLCAACKKELDVCGSNVVEGDDTGTSELETKSLLMDEGEAPVAATKSRIELEALCAEQATTIRKLNNLVEQYRHEHGQSSTIVEGSTECVMPTKQLAIEEERPQVENLSEETHRDSQVLQRKDTQRGIQEENHSSTNASDKSEREVLLKEIQNLRSQLKSFTDMSTNGCLLDQIRNGSSSLENVESDYEKERQRWTESESRWISLTEELRVELESNRKLAEKRDIELNLEKKCTAELDDALHRSILGHARIIEHYAELQEEHTELLARHRKVMEGIAAAKKAAMKAGSKGTSKAFAAALAAEVSALQVERERERALLKEQNKELRIQLRDTAEAVHAAGELLVRLREAEEAVSVTETKSEQAHQENDRLRKQVERLKKKHAMEMVTMKHYLAESRLPVSAVGPLFHQEDPDLGNEDETRATSTTFPTNDEDDQSWRAAFTPSYQ